MRVVVHHPEGDIAVYAVVSVDPAATRPPGMTELPSWPRWWPPIGRCVLVMGDLNTATTDPVLDTLTAQVTDSRETVKGGFGFAWPADFRSPAPTMYSVAA